MTNLVKTTVTIPEEMLQNAKLAALQQKTTLSDLIREGLEFRIRHVVETRAGQVRKNPLRFLGRINIGIKTPYPQRANLYEQHLKRKMGF